MKVSNILKRTGLTQGEIGDALSLAEETVKAWASKKKNAIPEYHWDSLINLSMGAITKEMLQQYATKKDKS